jgi:hypothetical protein
MGELSHILKFSSRYLRDRYDNKILYFNPIQPSIGQPNITDVSKKIRNPQKNSSR